MEEEDLPLFINQHDDHAVFVNNELEDHQVEQISFTKFVPGARWMYSKYRTEYFRTLSFTFVICYSLEVFSAVWNLSYEKNHLLIFSSLAGLNYFCLIFGNSVLCEELLLNRLGFKTHLLALANAGAYWSCSKVFFLGPLAAFTAMLPVCFDKTRKPSFFVYMNGVFACLRFSLAAVFAVFGIIDLIYCLEDKEKQVLKVVIAQISLFVLQDFHLGATYLLYFFNQDRFLVNQGQNSDASIFLTLITNLLVYLFQIINN